MADYELPPATPTTLGGIKVGANLTVDEEGVLDAQAMYVLPYANTTVLGGVKIGQGLAVDPEGTVSVISQGGGGGGGLELASFAQTVTVAAQTTQNVPMNLPGGTTSCMFFLIKTTLNNSPAPAAGYAYNITIKSGTTVVYRAEGLAAPLYDNIPVFTESSGAYQVAVENNGDESLNISLAITYSSVV